MVVAIIGSESSPRVGADTRRSIGVIMRQVSVAFAHRHEALRYRGTIAMSMSTTDTSASAIAPKRTSEDISGQSGTALGIIGEVVASLVTRSGIGLTNPDMTRVEMAA
mmetsp:Transcript_92766/g.239585  ORF Transcript_92766/g.239585 Transcript_92766/m.239585 type:complete len:108 (-) Transcript_92766:1820-2143(-)